MEYEKFKEYPYYDWHDESSFAFFMIELLGYLEVRHFEPYECIYGSMENPEEFYFCQEGRWDVGYEINNVKRYCLQFGPRTTIGAFNLMFDQRLNYIYRAGSTIEALAIRRPNWKKLEQNFSKFAICLKLNVMNSYQTNLRRPLRKKKA